MLATHRTMADLVNMKYPEVQSTSLSNITAWDVIKGESREQDELYDDCTSTVQSSVYSAIRTDVMFLL